MAGTQLVDDPGTLHGCLVAATASRIHCTAQAIVGYLSRSAQAKPAANQETLPLHAPSCFQWLGSKGGCVPFLIHRAEIIQFVVRLGMLKSMCAHVQSMLCAT
jgi:hypothetical protein